MELNSPHEAVFLFLVAAAATFAGSAGGTQGSASDEAGGGGTWAAVADMPQPPDDRRLRLSVLHPNPQSVLDGLRAGFVNVSSGNLTFERRDIVVPGIRPVVLSRIHDTRIRTNHDFGPGWRLSLAEEVYFQDGGTLYVDRAGAQYRFRAGVSRMYVPDPPLPRISKARLSLSGNLAVLQMRGETRVFARAGTDERRFLLKRIDSSAGGWIEFSHRDGRVEAVFDEDGLVLRAERDAKERIVLVSDRHGRTVRYGYDPEGRLAEVHDLAGNLWLHEYDAADRLTAAIGVDGDPYLRVRYDAAGRVAWTSGEAEFGYAYGADRTEVEGPDLGRPPCLRTNGSGSGGRTRLDDGHRLAVVAGCRRARGDAGDVRDGGAASEHRAAGVSRGWRCATRLGNAR